MSDLYTTLWVTKSASQDEIKKAYRKKAMEWHPDKHKWDEKAEKKFKEINEAYQTLSDDGKRKQYDTFGSTSWPSWGWWAGGFGGGFWWFEDVFRQAAWWARWRQGWAYQNVEFDLNDLFGSFWQWGMSGMWWSQRSTKQSQAKNDIEQSIEIPLWDLVLGTKVRLKWPDGKTFKLTIPEGTKPGTKFKVSGKGKSSMFGWKGDLYLRIQPTMPDITDEMREHIEKWR